MATKYDDQPVYRVNRFIENRLRGIRELGGPSDPNESFIPPEEDYNTDLYMEDGFKLPFMMAGQQSPEILTMYDYSRNQFKNLPFAVYSLMLPKDGAGIWSESGQVTYNFYWQDMAGLFSIGSFLNELLRREDWSALDINYFYRKDSTNPFEFKNICALASSGPTPIEDEGGRSSFMVSVYYEATYEGKGRVDDYQYVNGPAGWGMR